MATLMSRGWEKVTEADLVSTFGRRLIREAPKRVVPAIERPAVKTSRRFDYADTLKQQIALVGLPAPVRDYQKAIPGRRFKLDLAWVDLKVSCEVDGGEWAMTNNQQARHGHALGMQSDCIKQNLLLLLGWKPYRFTGSQVESGYALNTMEKALKRAV